ncbi:unnamed protein product [Prunus armeniaca]
MRQSIALGITKLISAREANFGNLIRIFSCRAQGTFSRVLGGQGNVTHDPVPNLESTGFDLTHDPVPKLVNEVKPISTGATASVPKERENCVSPVESLLDDLVYGFNLAIGLRMGWGGEAKTYLETNVSMRAAVMVAKSSFTPFGEVVHNYNCILDLALALRHRSNEVKSSLGEWPRTDHDCQWFSWKLWDVGKPLTLVALLGEGLGISMK